MEQSYPKYADIEEPLLLYIYEHGGSKFEVTCRSTYEPLADIFGLSPSLRSRTRDEEYGDGHQGRAWHNKVQWARENLRKRGYLAASPYGIWRLSAEGVQAARKLLRP